MSRYRYSQYIEKISRYLQELNDCFTTRTKVSHIRFLQGQIEGLVDDLNDAINEEIDSCSIIFIEESENQRQ